VRIEAADLGHPAVVALIEHHLREAHRNSPPGSVFALDLSGMRDPTLSLFAAWEGDTLLGLGALKQLAADHGELKSMRTAPDQLRKGVATAMLGHLLATARSRGYRRVSLETGTNEAFAPARAMYEAAGFTPCAAFGDYELTDFNRCYSLAL
jgi:putative acetyltransferase